MTDSNPTNVKFIVEYDDGPLQGETETRVLINGEYDKRLGSVAALEGKESLFWYNATSTKEIAGELHVHYAFDNSDSDPVASDDDQDGASLNL